MNAYDLVDLLHVVAANCEYELCGLEVRISTQKYCNQEINAYRIDYNAQSHKYILILENEE